MEVVTRMERVQLNETVVATRGHQPEIEFSFFSLPRSIMDEKAAALLDTPAELVRALKVTGVEGLLISELPWEIFALLLAADRGEPTAITRRRAWLSNQTKSDRELFALAEYLAFADIVTFPLSAPRPHSLASLAVESAGHVAKAVDGVGKAAGAALPVKIVLGAAAAAVVIKGAVLGLGVVAVVDGIGVVTGVASSKKTHNQARKAFDHLRQGLRGLVRRR